MTDLRMTVTPKSDQLNYDDMIGGTKTIKITGVKVRVGDQPVVISYEGDEGKPYLPCKSMRRVMITCWGSNGDEYVGKSLKLYGDKNVKWGGQEVGGIRISHMSNIEGKQRMALTETRGKRTPFVVDPLVIEKGNEMSADVFKEFGALIDEAADIPTLQEVGAKIKAGKFDDDGNKRIKKVFSAKMKTLRSDV